MTSNTMSNQTPIRNVLKNIFSENGYQVFTEAEFAKSTDFPEKYVIQNSRYKTIYGTRGTSEFLVVNIHKNIKVRVELKIQQQSGSVDEKYPYLYINSLTMHPDDVIIILEGDGFKPGAKEWIKDKIEENWLNDNKKAIKLFNLMEAIKYFTENL